MSLPEGRERKPQQEDEFEGIVEEKPVNDTYEALNDPAGALVSNIMAQNQNGTGSLREEGKHNPVLRMSH